MSAPTAPFLRLGIATGFALAQAACTSISGLGGSSSYACKAPEGVTCNSVSGIYANALQNNLPSQRTGAPASNALKGAPIRPPERERSPTQPRIPASGDREMQALALRSSPRIIRLWFKPWEDADHDLYDQGYVYVQVDAGQWQIERVQRQIREAYLPARAPAATTNHAAALAPRPAPRARQNPALSSPALIRPASAGTPGAAVPPAAPGSTAPPPPADPSAGTDNDSDD